MGEHLIPSAVVSSPIYPGIQQGGQPVVARWPHLKHDEIVILSSPARRTVGLPTMLQQGTLHEVQIRRSTQFCTTSGSPLKKRSP